MKVKDLIKQLQELPTEAKNATVETDDGTGWATDDVYLVYDRDDKTLGIYGK